ncbi:hypothetical protein CVT24_009027, partial [Panaeolus cyanescens]
PPSPSDWKSRPRSQSRPRPAEPEASVTIRPPPPPEAPKLVREYLPPTPWPPDPSEYPADTRSYRVVYDPAFEVYPTLSYLAAQTPGYYRALIEHIRKYGSEEVVQDRIKGKGKGKELLRRYEGKIMTERGEDGFKEEEVVVCDPRKDPNYIKPNKPIRTEFVEVHYEYDQHSTGPPPPCSVLITNVSPLTPNSNLRRNFLQHGNIMSFEPQIDKENGSALGIIALRYSNHDEAKRCVEKEDGRKGGIIGAIKPGEVEEWRVVFDGDGSKLKAVLKDLEERRKREREERKKGPMAFNHNGATPSGGSSSMHGGVGNSATPQSGRQSPIVRKPLNPQSGGGRGQWNSGDSSSRTPQGSSGPPLKGPHALPAKPPPPTTLPGSKPTPAANESKASGGEDSLQVLLRDAREKKLKQSEEKKSTPAPKPLTTMAAMTRGRKVKYDWGRLAERSPSPTSRLAVQAPGVMGAEPKSEEDKKKEYDEVLKQLAASPHDHVKIQCTAQLVRNADDEAVKEFFENFPLDKILRDHSNIYVTFTKGGIAHRAVAVLASKTLKHQSVALTSHAPPAYTPPEPEKTDWTEAELVEEAQKLILRDLKRALEQDIAEKLVGRDINRSVTEIKAKGPAAVPQEQKLMDYKRLKTLSFKKKKGAVEEHEAEREADEEDHEMEDDADRPKKKRKTEMVVKKARRVIDDDVESEDEAESEVVRLSEVDSDGVKKRLVSEDRDDEDEPVRKKAKIQVVEGKAKKGKKGKKDVVDATILGETEAFEAPAVAQIIIDGTAESSISPSRSPSPRRTQKRRKHIPTPPPTPPPFDPIAEGLGEDDEDFYFARLVLEGKEPEEEEPEPEADVPSTSADVPTFRKHITGSARTEGYYKITHAEKAAYVAQYQARAANAGSTHAVVDEPQPQQVTSSRSNRATARRRAQGLEEINQVQRAVALSKGETAANELTFKFNQLQTRKKHLRFARSPIHDWGLYAMEKISRGEMVIEYVGEVIRAAVADKREKAYERQGIGSSYLFRIDEDLVVDATKKGNLGRLINHSCDPNCTAKIITISGEKKIVIYAKQDIDYGDEITYDYHFPFEQDKIPCLCGSAKCRGFLN